ncbi:hypothetical protein V5R04_15635 [Jonesiaceae bacterium BS-20]|uniref:Uncharacterized protein n=1 Tax=Jonesiaceae bacterium BS-20 TaxID=3120821 RepID=A0AAU7DX88_9MICO
MLDLDDRVIGEIDGVTGGNLQHSASTTVKQGGSLEVVDVDGIDWLHARVKVWRHVGDLKWSRGVYIPSAPMDRWVDGQMIWDVELQGKLSLLSQDEVADWVEVPEGTLVTGFVTDYLHSLGHENLRITESDLRLRTGRAFAPGTTSLHILNDLLDSISYWGMQAGLDGYLEAKPYVRPADRPARYHFVNGENCIYLDDLKKENPLYKVPNRFLVFQTEESERPPLVGVAENLDPDSPFSIPNRGVIAEREENSDLATKPELDARARTRLLERMSNNANVELQHAPLPLELNEAITLERSGTSIQGLHTVQSMTESLVFDADIQTTVREVARIGQ